MVGRPPPEQRCTATSKRSGNRCGAWAMRGHSVCYHHGGRSPRGIASPHFDHGRYSASVPSNLLGSYEEMLSDDRKLELADEVGLLQVRNRELLESLDSGESGPHWIRMRDEVRAMEKTGRRARIARDRGDADAEAKHQATQAEHLNELLRMIRQGAPPGERWAEIRAVMDLLRRLAESERKRKLEEHELATTEELAAMMAAVLSVVRDNVTDEEVLERIAADVDALMWRLGGESEN